MKVLVTGGAGYIGSFMVRKFLDDGNQVVVVDNLERGNKGAVDKRASLLVGDLLDDKFVARVFSQYTFDAVIHFAAYALVGESVERPGTYFANNIFSTINILDQIKGHQIPLIFSSSAGVYGKPQKIPIPEDHPANPINPYGESKLLVERILSWYQLAHGIDFVSLRYFNAAGGALDGSIGEDHRPETHIIPNAIKAALRGTEFTLYGDDYPTPDETCIRDYIHVIDLIKAHTLALEMVRRKKGGFFYNVGTGNGHSNKKIIDMVKKVSSVDIKVVVKKRRPGDPVILVADPMKIKNELGFVPKYSDLKTIVESAWKWHKSHPKGYES